MLWQGRYGDTSTKRLYEIVFTAESPAEKLFLVLPYGMGGNPRLLIHRAGNPDAPNHVLNLYGVPGGKELLEDRPMAFPINLSTLFPASGDRGMQRIALRGRRNGATLDVDPNHLMFNRLGEVRGRTLMGYKPYLALLMPVEVPDPKNQGRQLFNIVAKQPEDKPRYSLVLAPTETGPHRLLVKEGGILRHVLSLHDGDRRYHVLMQSVLVQTSPREQQAIAALRELVGYDLRFEVIQSKVTRLDCGGAKNAASVAAALQQLPHLERLDFGSSPLGEDGLNNLHTLSKLKSVRFGGADIANAGLKAFKDSRQLQALTFYCCRGITDEGLEHLSRLTNLEYLRLYREDSLRQRPFSERLVTDAGIAHLQNLTKLKHLDLLGQNLGDAGLEIVGRFTELETLLVSGENITDDGLRHLSGLRKLKQLQIHPTQITQEGIEQLESTLPDLQIAR